MISLCLTLSKIILLKEIRLNLLFCCLIQHFHIQKLKSHGQHTMFIVDVVRFKLGINKCLLEEFIWYRFKIYTAFTIVDSYNNLNYI